MLIRQDFEFNNSINENIYGELLYEDDNSPKPAVFCLHGFKSFKNWGYWRYVRTRLADSGFIAVGFNFSLIGIDETTERFAYPEKFARNSVSQEIEDASLVLMNFRDGSIIFHAKLDKIWNGRIFMLGHSLGGAISLLLANEYDFINKVACWASIAKFGRYTYRQKKDWLEKKYIDFEDSRTKQLLRLNVTYLDDIKKNQYDYKLRKAAENLRIPVLLVHGGQDLTVKIKEFRMLAGFFHNNIKTKIVAQTGHTFGCEHPFKSTTKALDEALSETIAFFEET